MTEKSSTYAEIAVLALLAELPRYGYEIDAEVKNRGLHHWGKVAISSIYYLLGRLEKEGHVTFTYQKEGKYPTRKVYSITPAGRAFLETHLFNMLGSCSEPHRPMMGIAFIHVLPKEKALEALRRMQQRFVEMEEHYKRRVEETAHHSPFPTSRALLRLWGDNIEYMHLWLRRLYRELEAYPWPRWEEETSRRGFEKEETDE
ncbi:MAG TPA: PadR family transcriptional regulator [Candidatus Coatesbacteria bacterium]|mgnify:CR=1 FL=1|nr:PadR family transcriptional regulator [Candidatus Coatesbacteria bacterium]